MDVQSLKDAPPVLGRMILPSMHTPRRSVHTLDNLEDDSINAN